MQSMKRAENIVVEVVPIVESLVILLLKRKEIKV
jgi:hypothetical protein